MIIFKHKGNLKKTDKFLNYAITSKYFNILEKYGQEGVSALSAATPMDSGKTSYSWDYTISKFRGGAKITWNNSNVIDGVPIAVLIQYGHATRNGGYIQGRDFINPAIRPIFDKLTIDLWREVTSQ